MKAVSGKTCVQKAVFLEPKPLFSSAFTMWIRGWYLCIEFKMICKRENVELIVTHVDEEIELKQNILKQNKTKKLGGEVQMLWQDFGVL